MSLTSLIIANGSTLEETVAALGISGYLIERIEAGRQPLPFELAEQLAAHLGVEVGDVIAEVDRVSTTGARAGCCFTRSKKSCFPSARKSKANGYGSRATGRLRCRSRTIICTSSTS